MNSHAPLASGGPAVGAGLLRPLVTRRGFLGRLGGAALIPALGVPLAGCGSNSDSGGGGSKTSGSVTFVYYGTADDQKTYDKLFEKFRAQYPEITLKAQGVAGRSWAEFANTVGTRMAGGQAIDVLQIATEGQRIFMSKDLLDPLDDYIKQDQATVDAYYKDTPAPIRTFLERHASKDGHTYFIQGGYNTMALYLSTKIFRAAGVEPPTDTWTWDQFRAAGQQIKARTGAFLTTCSPGYFTDVMPWMLTNGAAPISDDWTQSTIDSPEAVEALTFARSLVVDGLAPKPGGAFDLPSQMAQGRLATFGGGRWMTNELRRAKIVDQVELVKWPQKAKPGSPVGWQAWPILKASKNKDAAWTLIKFLMSEEFGDVVTSGGGDDVPARISDATGPGFTTNAPKNTELLVKLLDVATPVPGPSRGAETERVISEAWLQGISGTKDPQAALSEANSKLQELLT